MFRATTRPTVRKLRAPGRLFVVALAIAAIGTGTAMAAAMPGNVRHGTERIVFMGTSTTSSVSSVIATGPFTGGGSIDLGANKGLIRLAGGTLTIAPVFGPTKQTFSKSTCLMTITGRGTYKLGHGTGRYAGINGHGTFALSSRQVNARAGGKCSATKAVAFQEVIGLSGPVTVRK